MRDTLIAAFVLAIAVALGCGTETENSGLDQGGVSNGRLGRAGDGGSTNGTTACGEQKLPLSDFAPNLLLVMDRTCSMGCHLPSGQQKWKALQKATSDLLLTHDKDIRFGLMMTGSLTKTAASQCSPACPPGDLQVKPALGNGAAINAKLAAIPAPADQSPPPPVGDYTCLASITSAAAALNDPTRKSYILLATDGFAPAHCDGATPKSGGSPSGSPTTAPMTAATLDAVRQLANNGIKSFVLGFDDNSATTNKNNLNALADVGGAPRAGATHYYAVSSESDLDAVLKAIGTAVASCTFPLTNAPPADQIGATFDGVTVPRDGTNGWDVDPGGSSLTFHGASCNELQSGKVMKASLIFACTVISPVK